MTDWLHGKRIAGALLLSFGAALSQPTASTWAALPAISRGSSSGRIACDQMLSAPPSQPYQRSWAAFHSDGALRSSATRPNERARPSANACPGA